MSVIKLSVNTILFCLFFQYLPRPGPRLSALHIYSMAGGNKRESSRETGSELTRKRVRRADPTFICSCSHKCIKPTLLKPSTWYHHRKWREEDEAKAQARGESAASSSSAPQEASRSRKLTRKPRKNKQKFQQIEQEPEGNDKSEQPLGDNLRTVPYDEVDVPGLVGTICFAEA